MASLDVPAPAATVGGAGTAPVDVPAPKSSAGDVSELPLAWALQEDAFSAAVEAAASAEAGAPAKAERLTRTLCVGYGKTPDEAAAHLQALRSGTAAGSTRLEREYAALFEAVRAARSRLLAGISRGDFTVGLPCPSLAELTCGRRLPAAGVAALLHMEPAAVVSACDAIDAGLAATGESAAVLLDVYDAMDMTPKAAAARLRTLALGGVYAKELSSPATPTEAAYAAHFEGVRGFRAAVVATLAREGIPATVEPLDTPSATVFSGTHVSTLTGHSDVVRALACLPDGRLASASFDRTVRVWDVPTGVCAATLSGHTERVRLLVRLPDGRLASSGDDNTVKLWNVATGPCDATLRGHTGFVSSLACLPDGRLASGSNDGIVKVWDVASGSCAATLSGHTDLVRALVVLPDGRLASGSWDKTIKLWNVATGSCVATLSGHTGFVCSLVVLPDSRLASGGGSFDKTIKLWNVTTGSCVATLSGHTGPVYSLVVLPDGRLASGGEDKTIKLWDVARGSCLATIAHSCMVVWLLVLPDGRLASSGDDGTVKLWR